MYNIEGFILCFITFCLVTPCLDTFRLWTCWKLNGSATVTEHWKTKFCTKNCWLRTCTLRWGTIQNAHHCHQSAASPTRLLISAKMCLPPMKHSVPCSSTYLSFWSLQSGIVLAGNYRKIVECIITVSTSRNRVIRWPLVEPLVSHLEEERWQ